MPIRDRYGWHLTQMFEGMERGELKTLYVMGENPAQSEADINRTRQLLSGLDFMVVQDILFTKTCEYADVVLPSSASWGEAEGTVTSSERRVQRVRKALDPPGEARDDTWILCELARRLGHDWGDPTAEEIWDECRSLSPMHAGMRYDRLEEMGGIQWPCPDEEHPGSPFLHSRLWQEPAGGAPAPFSVVEHSPAGRRARLRLSAAAHHRAAPGVLQHGRAVQPLPLAAAQGRGAVPLARGRRGAARRGGRDREGDEPARLGRGARAHRVIAAPRASRSCRCTSPTRWTRTS